MTFRAAQDRLSPLPGLACKFLRLPRAFPHAESVHLFMCSNPPPFPTDQPHTDLFWVRRRVRLRLGAHIAASQLAVEAGLWGFQKIGTSLSHVL